MKKECKKFIKKIKRLGEGDSISYFDYEILCIVPKSDFMIIHDMDMKEVSFSELLDFIKIN